MLKLSVTESLLAASTRLADELLVPMSDPMAPEWITVPTSAMQRWLQLELAKSLGASSPENFDGVATNIAMNFPGALRQVVLKGDKETAQKPRDDPWQIDTMVWALFEVLEAHHDDSELAGLFPLPEGVSSYGVARQIADLFDRYVLRRPELIIEWTVGHDVDVLGRPLRSDVRWQPHLWRLVRAGIDSPSSAERLPMLLKRVRNGELQLELPERLFVFGVTTLAGGHRYLDLLEAISTHREVHAYFLDPSIEGLSRVRKYYQLVPPGVGYQRSTHQLPELLGNPLLASWGRPYRERTQILSIAQSNVDTLLYEDNNLVLEGAKGAGNESLLATLQSDLRGDRCPSGAHALDPNDRSVQIYECHGIERQIEVLRDAILHLLKEQPTLSEDDIVILCPQLSEFAPYIPGGFGPSANSMSAGAFDMQTDENDAPPFLSYRLVDRSMIEQNPVMDALHRLLALLSGRFSSRDVLDLLALAPLRRRFSFDDHNLALITELITETNVRWGLNAVHRENYGFSKDFDLNTWESALKRLLLGVAMSDSSTLQGSLAIPFGVESDGIETIGQLARIVAQMNFLRISISHTKTLHDWCEEITDLCDFFFATDVQNSWQFDQIRRLLSDVIASAQVTGEKSTPLLSYADMRVLLADRGDMKVPRPDFFRGGITISSLVPLRWVPYRVVCLLGFDGAESREAGTNGDDLAEIAPLLGDSDPQAETRQSYLEAIIAAQECLVITRMGFDIARNQQVTKSTLFSEIEEVILATLDERSRGRWDTQICIEHPRQRTSRLNFAPQTLGISGPWSFDAEAKRGAEARACREREKRPFFANSIERVDEDVISLANLHAFYRHPIGFFLHHSLEAETPVERHKVEVELPMEIGALDYWTIGNRLLLAGLRGEDIQRGAAREILVGMLPIGSVGVTSADKILSEVEPIIQQAKDLGHGSRETGQLIDITLNGGLRVVGEVPASRFGEHHLLLTTFSKHSPELDIEMWIDLIILEASGTFSPASGVVLTRDHPQGKLINLKQHTEVSGDSARTALDIICDLYRRGSREPLPLFRKFSQELYPRPPALPDPKSSSWKTFLGFGDGNDPFNTLVLGDLSLSELLAISSRSDDPGEGVSRAMRLAMHLWGAFYDSTEPELTKSSGKPRKR